MRVQFNDDKFSRTRCTHNCGDGERFVEWTMAKDCTNDKVQSSADLRGTQIKFPENVESLYVTGGHLSSGGAEVSMERQYLTIESGGYCGQTYIPNDFNDSLSMKFLSRN